MVSVRSEPSGNAMGWGGFLTPHAKDRQVAVAFTFLRDHLRGQGLLLILPCAAAENDGDAGLDIAKPRIGVVLVALHVGIDDVMIRRHEQGVTVRSDHEARSASLGRAAGP